MLQCPVCKGYGKTVSTRNLDNEVVRYHKCEDCGETFTSTQRVNSLSITNETIDSILKSPEFRFAVSPLFQAFSLYDYYFYHNGEVQPSNFNNFVLSSISFDDSVEHIKCRFDINLSVLGDKATGIIELVNILRYDDKCRIFPVAIVGVINFDKEWKVQLDLTVIHSLLYDSNKQEVDNFVEIEAIRRKLTTSEALDAMSNEDRKNYLTWLRLKICSSSASKDSK